MEVRNVASNIATQREFKADKPTEDKVELKVLSGESVEHPEISANAESYILNISDEAKALNTESREISKEIAAYDPGGGHPKRPKKKTE